MRLVRFGPPNQESPGILDSEGTIRDLSALIPDISGPELSKGALGRIREVDPQGLPKVASNARLGPCVVGVGNFIAVGLNYADHARETGSQIPTEPVLFNKAPSCISGPNDDIILPRGSAHTDWEAEVAVVIGAPIHAIAEKDVPSAIAGYCICHDVSERAFQNDRGGQWMKGKSAPSFGPLGPWLVTPDEIPDPQELTIWLDVNGTCMQAGTTGEMIFSIPYLVSYISQFMRLDPGDVITTGTPAGVGQGRKPPIFLKDGDIVRIVVDGLGEQRQTVVAHWG